MSSHKKFVSKVLQYIGLKRSVKKIVYGSDRLYFWLSLINFYINNTFNLKINRIPFFILSNISKDSVIIDCGANVGQISKPLIKYGPSLIVCFEPNPLAFKELSKNIGHHENVKLVEKAVGIKDGKLKLYNHVSSDRDPLKHSVSSSLFLEKSNVNSDDFYEVEVCDFISFLKSIDRKIHILKIDIEGAEIDLLNELINERLYNNIEYIFVETHEDTLLDLEKSTKLLKERVRALGIRNIYFNWV